LEERAVTVEARPLEGFAAAQSLAYRCAKTIARELREGWTEAQAARLMDVWLMDHGVRNFFHTSFAWFGERTRFDGMRRWRDFIPGGRALRPGEAVILDTAPVVGGWPADIGYSTSLGPNQDVERGREFLAQLRRDIALTFSKNNGSIGARVCGLVEGSIRAQGYDVVHRRYPGGVLGHRLRRSSDAWRPPTFIPFGWTALASVLRHGPASELLNESQRGDPAGTWAIEPHFGGAGFGCKFEEVLVVDGQGARWLSSQIPW
jgi:Xaa-Pro aminopeptidase